MSHSIQFSLWSITRKAERGHHWCIAWALWSRQSDTLTPIRPKVCGNNCGNLHTNSLQIRIKPIDMAEREGFEPSIRSYNRMPDFESGAFDHSAIFPMIDSNHGLVYRFINNRNFKNSNSHFSAKNF
jgi:hypothetical protein